MKIFPIASQKRVVLEARDPIAEEVISIASSSVFVNERNLHSRKTSNSITAEASGKQISNSERDRRSFSRLCSRARKHVKGDPIKRRLVRDATPDVPRFRGLCTCRGNNNTDLLSSTNTAGFYMALHCCSHSDLSLDEKMLWELNIHQKSGD